MTIKFGDISGLASPDPSGASHHRV